MDFLSNRGQVPSLFTAPAARVSLGLWRFQGQSLCSGWSPSERRPRGQGVREGLEAVHSEEAHTQAAAARPQALGNQPAAPSSPGPRSAHLSAAPGRPPGQPQSLGSSQPWSLVFSPKGHQRLCSLTPGRRSDPGQHHRENSGVASGYSSSKSYKSTSRVAFTVHMENTHAHIHLPLKRETSTLFSDNVLLTQMALMFPSP